MARDPLKSYTIPNRKAPLKTGGGQRKAKESPAEFLARLVKKMPRSPEPMDVMMTVLEGDLSLVALYYGVDENFVKDVCAVHKNVKDAMMRARAIRVSRERDGASVADQLRKDALDEIAKQPDMPTRERWPADPKDRLAAYRDWLIDEEALVLYEGDLARISEAGRIPMHTLVKMVKSDDRLAALKVYGDEVHAARMESRLREMAARSNQPTAALKLIEAFGDERFTPRSRVDVRKVGFEAPQDDDDEMESVLTVVMGGAQ